MMSQLTQHPGVLFLGPGEILDWYLQAIGTAGG
jgi:hypothetical protein